MTTKDEQLRCTQLIFRCFECKKNYKKDINKELIKRSAFMNFAMKTLIDLFCY